jgi:hypothetical protein
MKGASLGIATFLLASASWAEQPVTGSWDGVALEVLAGGETQLYTIQLHIGADGAGKTNYPTLACGGVLSLLRKLGDVLEFRERLTFGRDNCVDNGTIGVWLKAGKLVWYWTGEDSSEPESVASAVLRPAAPRPDTKQ